MAAGLYLLQCVVVVNVLRRVVKVDQDLGVAVRQKAVDGVCMHDALKKDKDLDELIERRARAMGLIDHPGFEWVLVF